MDAGRAAQPGRRQRASLSLHRLLVEMRLTVQRPPAQLADIAHPDHHKRPIQEPAQQDQQAAMDAGGGGEPALGGAPRTIYICGTKAPPTGNGTARTKESQRRAGLAKLATARDEPQALAIEHAVAADQRAAEPDHDATQRLKPRERSSSTSVPNTSTSSTTTASASTAS